MKKRIYLDYAATIPIKKEAAEKMLPYFSGSFGNPSSIHSFGREARAAIDEARREVSKFLKCKPTEILFTSGGTEADNLAIRGVVSAVSRVGLKPHIVTTAIEHDAVIKTVRDLEKRGLIEASYIKPQPSGAVLAEDVISAIKDNTILVSVMYVNNETGVIQPIREIGKKILEIKKLRMGRKQTGKAKELAKFYSELYFHTDAAQAAGYLDCYADKLMADLISLSAHKIGGPKGAGCLYVRAGTKLQPTQTGGGQEFRMRAGTENVVSIVGFGEAVRADERRKTCLAGRQAKDESVKKLKEKLIEGTMKKIADVQVNGDQKISAPHIVNFSFGCVEGESILLNLDLAGIAVSTGSACSSGSLEPSHTLLAMGLSVPQTHGSVRFSLGRETTKEEIDYTVKVLAKVVKRLRDMSVVKACSHKTERVKNNE